VRAADGGGYVVDVPGRAYAADQVVVATGPFQVPRVPPMAADLHADVVQLHSADYRTPDALPPGPVVVVGGGNTGFQIAAELSATHDVHLSIGSRQAPLPQRLLGRDLFRWLEATGLMRKNVDSRLAQRLKDKETLVGMSPRALHRRHGVRLRGRTVAASGSDVVFEDGTRMTASAVIWATGFTLDHSFVDLPVFDERGAPVHRRGVTSSPGLYFLGLPWQWTRGSALIGWVGDDARYLADQIAAFEPPQRAAAPSVSPAPAERAR